MTDSIHQEVTIKASPKRVYAALTDEAQFAAMTGGAPAKIAREPGGAFSCFGGKIEGRQIELAPSKRIVQAWRAGNWDAGVYSLVRFELKGEGGGTRLVFDQAGVPDGQAAHLEASWGQMYWEPLKKFLA
jgi:activator of HSP90 ATPase